MKIGSIVIRCHDFDRMVAFWQAALHYVPREPAKDGWVVLRVPEDKGPNLSFQGRDRRPRSRSWLHLDLYNAGQQAGGCRSGDSPPGQPSRNSCQSGRSAWISAVRSPSYWP